MHASESQWCTPPEQLALGREEVHVWRASLEQPGPDIQALEQLLASDEQARAEQFRFQKDRLHYIIARGTLRSILGRYLGKDPHTLRFSYSTFGKPALVQNPDSNALFFNVTHSRGLALYGITRGYTIGIDIEYLDAGVSCEQIAARFFSPLEVNMLRAVPKELQHAAFFACWTRKEAYIKARGMGLSLDLKAFDVSLLPGDPTAILGSREEALDISHWSLYDISPGPGYIGALAVEGHPATVICFQWQQ